MALKQQIKPCDEPGGAVWWRLDSRKKGGRENSLSGNVAQGERRQGFIKGQGVTITGQVHDSTPVMHCND